MLLKSSICDSSFLEFPFWFIFSWKSGKPHTCTQAKWIFVSTIMEYFLKKLNEEAEKWKFLKNFVQKNFCCQPDNAICGTGIDKYVSKMNV